MPTPIWHGAIQGGRLHFDRRAEFDQHAAKLDGKRFELVLRPETKPHSKSQRGYLHLILDIFARESGRSLGEMKCLMKLQLLWDGESVDKAGLPILPHTEELGSARYAEFIDGVRRKAAECSIATPDPNDAE